MPIRRVVRTLRNDLRSDKAAGRNKSAQFRRNHEQDSIHTANTAALPEPRQALFWPTDRGRLPVGRDYDEKSLACSGRCLNSIETPRSMPTSSKAEKRQDEVSVAN